MTLIVHIMATFLTGFLILLYTLIPILQIKLSAVVFGCGWSAVGKWVANARNRRNNN